MFPIRTIEGTYVTEVHKGYPVEILYGDGLEQRTGTVENGTHPAVLTLKTDKGFRSFSRNKIIRLAYLTS